MSCAYTGARYVLHHIQRHGSSVEDALCNVRRRTAAAASVWSREQIAWKVQKKQDIVIIAQKKRDSSSWLRNPVSRFREWAPRQRRRRDAATMLRGATQRQRRRAHLSEFPVIAPANASIEPVRAGFVAVSSIHMPYAREKEIQRRRKSLRYRWYCLKELTLVFCQSGSGVVPLVRKDMRSVVCDWTKYTCYT